MAEPKKEDILDNANLDDVTGAEEVIDITEEASLGDPSVELDLLRAERDELRDKCMRALADAENSRKRAERDRREAEQYGGSKLARDLLPVYDNLNRALDAAGEEQRAAASG
jgi:molecular chaperone GrpE